MKQKIAKQDARFFQVYLAGEITEGEYMARTFWPLLNNGLVDLFLTSARKGKIGQDQIHRMIWLAIIKALVHHEDMNGLLSKLLRTKDKKERSFVFFHQKKIQELLGFAAKLQQIILEPAR